MWSWLRKLRDRKTSPQALAERGENVAARFLRNAGYKILERNFRCQSGEIDIVARQGSMLIFVEVKSRAYDDPTPEQQVGSDKQHRITRAAKTYLSRFGVPPAARFDVVAVVWPSGQDPLIRHTQGAFEATF
jgi:putative endonuclease